MSTNATSAIEALRFTTNAALVRNAPGTTSAVATATGVAVDASESASAHARPFKIYRDRFTVDLDAVPLIGSVTNEQPMISLFDYTCHHCRAMHPILHEVQQLFSNRLVIASLPMPLEPSCNPTMLRPNPMHTNACAYARLALAVWRADRVKHREFDNWLMTGERPPPLPDAEQKAHELVGADALAKAAQDPWVEEQLKLDVSIYEWAYRFQHGSMPQFIVGNAVAEGTLPREDLLRLLDQTLGLKVSNAP